MTTQTQVATTLDSDSVLNALVASHGNVALAAERLHASPQDIYSKLPDLSLDRLIQGVKAARVLQAFHAFTVMNDVVFQTLTDLSPEGRAKFMIQFMDRFEVMLNPPVHGGSGQPNSSSNNFQFNIGSPEAQEDARAQLFQRLHAVQQRASGDIQEVDSRPADQSTVVDADGASVHAPLRLGADGTARTARTTNSVDDMAPADGTGVGEDPDGRTDSAEEGGSQPS